MVLSVCGVQTLFNFNPLLKLDGYYLLSDWLEVPNLQQRGYHFKGRLRRLLWGAPPPPQEPSGRLLLGFGLATWLYSLAFLALVLGVLFRFAAACCGVVGLGGIALVGLVLAICVPPGMFRRGGKQDDPAAAQADRGVGPGDSGRPGRRCPLQIEDRAGGAFLVRRRSGPRCRRPVAGFVKEVYCDEGDRVSPGSVARGGA